jgi:hypothetical protein
MNKYIISASRRTDIPAFYAEWFVQRLEEGYLYVKSPYSSKRLRVSLLPENVQCIVFWSKNYSPLLSKIDRIERIMSKLFFHFTITGISNDIELDTPDYRYAVRDLLYLSKRYSPGHIIWRFDPIVLTDKLPFENYEDNFLKCMDKIRGHVKECYISFVHPYKKVLVNFDRYTDQKLVDPPDKEKKAYAERLSRLAEKCGIKLFACCNDYLLSETVHKGSCINAKKMAETFNDPSIQADPAPTRDECACTRSIDIGAYETCPHGCLYCYANTNKDKAILSYNRQKVEWNGLGFNENDGGTS